MLTTSPDNTRRGFSELDFALLKDVGYSVSASPAGTNIGGSYTNPDWGGSYLIPVEKTYADWLSPGGGGGGEAAPEPAAIFPVLCFIAFVTLSIRNRRKPTAMRTAVDSN